MDDPVLPWRRKVPRRFEVGDAPPDPPTPKDMHKRVYYEALDPLSISMIISVYVHAYSIQQTHE